MTDGVRKRRTALGVVSSLVVIGAALVYSYCLPRAWTMAGPSMEPALADHDGFLTLTLTPRIGDVVTIEVPSGLTIVKRVVGMPGDTVELRDGLLVRNGHVVTGPPRLARRPAGVFCARERLGVHVYDVVWQSDGFPDSHSPVHVPPHQVYVLGDHRDRSNDSRYFGALPIVRIRGRLTRILSRSPPTIDCAVSRTPR